MGGFEVWYRQQHPRLLTAMVVVCGDVEVARDLTSEAFARALERWDRVQAMDNPAGWTYAVAVNLARRRWRRRATEEPLADDIVPSGSPRRRSGSMSGGRWHRCPYRPGRRWSCAIWHR